VLAAECQIAWGVAPDQDPPSFDHVSKLERRIGRHTAILHWFLTWDESSHIGKLEKGTLEQVRGRGSLPFITWEPTGVPLQDIIAGKRDGYIDRWARIMADFGHPVMLAFMHEMDGNSYTWALGSGNSAQDYIGAYRHVHDRFRAAGADKVLWVFDVEGNIEGDRIRAAYPGDAYVDWLALNPYNAGAYGDGPWMSLVEVALPVYEVVAALNPTQPIMFGEWGSVEKGGSKAQWILEAGREIPARFPRLKAVVWFNMKSPDNPEEEWPLESSKASLVAARQAFGPGTPYCLTLADGQPAASSDSPLGLGDFYPADYLDPVPLTAAAVLFLLVAGLGGWLLLRRRKRTR
jgi:hypothetical protein